jgi:hypothetical protein
LFIFLTQLTTFMLVGMVEFWCWLILVRLYVPYCWLSWPLNLVTLSGGTKLTYIMMVVICNLHVEWCGHCTVKQTKIFLSKVVMVINGLWSTSFFGHPLYGNHKNGGYLLMWWDKWWRLPLVEFMHECTAIVDTTVLSVAHNRDFYILFLSSGNRTSLITYKSVAQLLHILTFVHVFTN